MGHAKDGFVAYIDAATTRGALFAENERVGLAFRFERRPNHLRLGTNGKAIHAVVACAPVCCADADQCGFAQERIGCPLRADVTAPTPWRQQKVVEKDCNRRQPGKPNAKDECAVCPRDGIDPFPDHDAACE